MQLSRIPTINLIVKMVSHLLLVLGGHFGRLVVVWDVLGHAHVEQRVCVAVTVCLLRHDIIGG